MSSMMYMLTITDFLTSRGVNIDRLRKAYQSDDVTYLQRSVNSFTITDLLYFNKYVLGLPKNDNVEDIRQTLFNVICVYCEENIQSSHNIKVITCAILIIISLAIGILIFILNSS